MHKGRIYPYHPIYWATEGWFWPGFVPWKLTLDVFDNGLPPWNIYSAGYGEVSIAGVVHPSRTLVTYDFVHFSPAFGLRVQLDSGVIAGVKQCRYRMILLSGVVEWAQAIRLDPIPQTVVFANSWPFVFPDPPYTANQSPPYQIKAARYDQGGSPWPPVGPP